MIDLSREIGGGSIFVLVYTVFEHTLSSSFFSENEISKRKTSEQVRKKGKDQASASSPPPPPRITGCRSNRSVHQLKMVYLRLDFWWLIFFIVSSEC